MTSTIAPLDLTKPWKDAWPDPVERASAYAGLVAVGCDISAARGWMATPVGVAYERAHDFLEIVTPWVESGLPTRDAMAWEDTLVFDPNGAWKWHAAGFTPEEAVFVHDVLSCGPPLPSVEAIVKEEARWVTSGLLPQEVLLGVAAGQSVSAMQQLARGGGLTSADAGTMRMYAETRGIRVKSLSINYNRLVPSQRVSERRGSQ